MRRAGVSIVPAALAALAIGPQPAAPATSGPSLREMAGQRIIFGFDGTSAPHALLNRIHRGGAGGVILFKRNISSRSQLRSLTRSLQDARPKGDPPLLITIDQEGGLVKRLDGPPDHSPAEIGRDGSSKLARHEGRATATNLRDVGVNVNFAPVVDVAVFPVAGVAPLVWLPPHAVAARAIRSTPVAQRARERVDSFRGNMESSRSQRFRGNLSTSLYIRKGSR